MAPPRPFSQHILNPQQLRVACLGPAASFSHLAAKRRFGEHAEFKFLPQADACRAVQRGDADVAVLPIENRISGTVDLTLDALYRTAQITIFDQLYLPIEQHLISHAADISAIQVVHTHPHAFLQCQHTLESIGKTLGKPLRQSVVSSTSRGVEMASADPTAAAIGSREAAELYQVPILRESIHDRRNNTTRFVMVAVGQVAQPTDHDRTAILFETAHRAGTLHQILGLFANEQINVLSLQNRPVHGTDGGYWEYAWFLECEGHVRRGPLAEVYAILRAGRLTSQQRRARCLGSFPERMNAQAS